MESDFPQRDYFLFINPKSGEREGFRLLNEIDDQGVKNNIYTIENNRGKQIVKVKANVYFINLLNKESINKGCQILIDKLQKQPIKYKKSIVAACGGDGTVSWVINILTANKIDTNLVTLTMIPLGTGNDFSRNFGWSEFQENLSHNQFKKFQDLLKRWEEADEISLDIWNFSLFVLQSGKIQQVSNSKSQDTGSKRLLKTFCNYFSFGVDGKVVYQFDKRRSGSRLLNNITYALLGVKNNFIYTRSILDMIEQFIECQYKPESYLHIPKAVKQNSEFLAQNNLSIKKVIIDNNSSQAKKNLQQYNMSNLLCLNINSWMGGTSNIWNNAKTIENQTTLKKHQSSHSDGKLQFMGFRNLLTMALEKQFPGFATPVVQGEGPFAIFFKTKEEQQQKVYFQIDGQGYRVTNPYCLLIEKYKQLPEGQIMVLVNKPKFQ